MVLIGSAAPPHSALAAWQFASHGVTQLPLFELQVGSCLLADRVFIILICCAL
jgi:hypothetical protein